MNATAHKIAVASRDGKLVYHFGQADRFLIYDISPEGSRYLETRETTPACDPDAHAAAGHEQTIVDTAALIADCRAVLVSRIGPGAAAVLQAQGIQPIEGDTFVEDALSDYLSCRGGRP